MNRCFRLHERAGSARRRSRFQYARDDAADMRRALSRHSGVLERKRSEAEQREPVWMVLAGHQFARRPAFTIEPPTAQEAPVIQEELQQAEVRATEMARQREVGESCWHVDGIAARISGTKPTSLQHNPPATDAISYVGYRFPPEVIGYAVWRCTTVFS